MNATGKRRLLKLADFLRTEVPEKKFYMERWSMGGDDPRECGTTACALGWATVIPSFRRAGLHLRNQWPRLRGYRSPDGFRVAARFFGIDYSAARALFGGGRPYVTPKEVARTIRQFVAAEQKRAA